MGKRKDRNGDGATKSAHGGGLPEWSVGPVMIGIFAILPPYLALTSAGFRLERYDAVFEALASVLAPVGEIFYPAVGVLATVLLTFAAATGLGSRVRKFPKRTRRVMTRALLIGVMTIVLMMAAYVTVAIAQPAKWLDVVVAFAVAWVAILGAQVVTDITSPRKRAKEADAAWRGKKQRAHRYRIARRDPAPHTGVRWTVEVLIWCLPVLLWVAVGMVVSSGHVHSPSDRWSLLSVCAVISFGLVLATLGWRLTADLSASPRVRIGARTVIVAVGVAASVYFGSLILAQEGYRALGIALIMFAFVHAVAVGTSGFGRRIPGFSLVERVSTVRSLRRAHAYRDETRALAADIQGH